MKEGWKYEKLGDIFHILNGFAFKSTKYVPEGIRVIRITNVQKGSVVDSSPKFYPIGELPLLTNYMLEDGDLLMSLTGNVGRVGIIDNSFLPAALNQRVACLRLKKNGILKQYLYHYLNSDYFEKICISNSKGAAQLNMSTVWLANHTIPIPPLPEQERIVSLLDAEFAKIDAIKANAENQLKDAKALFQSALKDYLTPKEGWIYGILGDIAHIVHGKNQREVADSSGKYPIYGSGGNIMGYAKDYLCDEGTTILGRKGTIDNPLYIDTKFWNVDTAFGVCAKNNADKKFLFYLIKNEDWQSRNTGTTLPSLTQSVVLNVPISYPHTFSEQLQIAEQLDTISAKIQSLQSNFDTTVTLCNDLKQSILKDIFG